MYSFSQTNRKSRRRGFSVVELLVAIGILTFLFVGSAGIFQYFISKTTQIRHETSARMDSSVLERVLFADLAALTPSLGNLRSPDSLNKRDHFFDYYPGLPLDKIPATIQSQDWVLDSSQSEDSIEFVVGAGANVSSAYFPVASVYEYNAALATFSTPGTLTYKNVNSKGFFTKNFPDYWKPGSYFLFYAPALYHPPTPLPLPPPSIASPPAESRPYAILGYVSSSGDDLVHDTVNGLWRTDHPLYSGITINSFDEYFRRLPAVGGAMAAVLVTPVKVVRYRLVSNPQLANRAKLYHSEKKGTQYQGETLYGTDLKRVIFKRPNVTRRLIEFTLELGI